MKLVLVNHKNPANINSFSGISYFMTQAIKKEFEQVVEYNDFENESMTNDLLNGNLKKQLEPFGKKLTSFMNDSDIKADYIFCQGGNTAIPYYNHSTPIAYWHDSTWNSIWRNYEDNTGFLDNKKFKVFKASFENLYQWDKKAMERADVVIFSSDYIAEAACRNYKIPNKKVRVIPFGANISLPPDKSKLENLLKDKLNAKELSLTFIGKDWQRKGLIAAVNLTNKLNYIGVPAKLNIIGCDPQHEKISNSSHVNLIGFINKSDKDQYRLFESVLETSHFLIHPALAEPFGIVLCEANAYGIPVIGTNVDGLKTTVVNGENGFLFNKNKFITKGSDVIRFISQNLHENYPPLVASTLKEFNQRLNWEVAVKELKKVLKESLC
jgi:glycosyltransferase involved in cell wall biosynthesis